MGTGKDSPRYLKTERHQISGGSLLAFCTRRHALGEVRMDIISPGFSGRRSSANVKLPPGQYLTTDFPALSAGPTPRVSLDSWQFTIDNGTKVLRQWDWKSFREKPIQTFTVDLHCVTRWSKLGTSWEGVSLDDLLATIEIDASYAFVHSYGDYSTNLPLKDLLDNQAWIAFAFDGKELAPEHGAPGPPSLFMEECEVGATHYAEAPG
jgi:DMSO/TMAO reductase YedYZ molybdopterin-dependent catalytic subunit